jgi:hypothetical protein
MIRLQQPEYRKPWRTRRQDIGNAPEVRQYLCKVARFFFYIYIYTVPTFFNFPFHVHAHNTPCSHSSIPVLCSKRRNFISWTPQDRVMYIIYIPELERLDSLLINAGKWFSTRACRLMDNLKIHLIKVILLCLNIFQNLRNGKRNLAWSCHPATASGLAAPLPRALIQSADPKPPTSRLKSGLCLNRIFLLCRLRSLRQTISQVRFLSSKR